MIINNLSVARDDMMDRWMVFRSGSLFLPPIMRACLGRYDARPPGKQVAHQNNNEPLDILYIVAVLTPYLLSCKSSLLH